MYWLRGCVFWGLFEVFWIKEPKNHDLWLVGWLEEKVNIYGLMRKWYVIIVIMIIKLIYLRDMMILIWRVLVMNSLLYISDDSYWILHMKLIWLSMSTNWNLNKTLGKKSGKIFLKIALVNKKESNFFFFFLASISGRGMMEEVEAGIHCTLILILTALFWCLWMPLHFNFIS